MLAANKLAEIIDPPGSSRKQYLFKDGNYGFRLYDHGRDEEAVQTLLEQRTTGGRPLPLISPKQAPSALAELLPEHSPSTPANTSVVDDLSNKELVGYLTERKAVRYRPKREVPWMQFRDTIAEQIAEKSLRALLQTLPADAWLPGGRKFPHLKPRVPGRAVPAACEIQ